MGSITDKDHSESSGTLPWADHLAIFSHLSGHIGADGALTEEGLKLPDEERKFGNEQIRWAAGALDGTLGHHAIDGPGEESEEPEEVMAIVKLVAGIASANSLNCRIELYELLCEDNLLFYIDPVIEKIVESKVPIEPHLHEYLRFLAFEGPDRGPVKFGIAILGLIADGRDLPGIIALGHHDEFTLFAAVAVSNILEDPDVVLWQIGKAVKGWGRIQIVERLAETENPDIKRWLLREGYKNSVMNEYLAQLCAVKGGLLAELEAPEVDDELLDGATGLLEAIMYGGPGEDIGEYDDGAEVVALYVEHMQTRATTLAHLVVLYMIREFLEDEEADWSEMKKLGWTEDTRANLLIEIYGIVTKPYWIDLVHEKKEATEDAEFWRVSQAAEYLGIDMWETYRRRLLEKPEESGRWFDIMREADEDRIDEIIALVHDNIVLEKIATGPAEEIGLGPEFAMHQNLDFVLQDLEAFPGKGPELVEAALQSPVIRTRNLALRVLSGWGESHWPEGMRKKLNEALPVEPYADTKILIEQVLMGEDINQEG